MSHRKLEYLNDNRIIYKRNPVNDEPSYSTEYYDFYEDGTHEYYNLFNNASRITSFKSLKWHSLVLCYLNDWDMSKHARIIRFICDKHNGFVTFKLNEYSVEQIIQQTFWRGIYAPKNKLRKIIFKDFCILDFNQKMKIVGELLGRQKIIDKKDIYECIINLSEDNIKITWGKIAKLLKCSERTVIRNLTNEIKKEKELLNKQNTN